MNELSPPTTDTRDHATVNSRHEWHPLFDLALKKLNGANFTALDIRLPDGRVNRIGSVRDDSCVPELRINDWRIVRRGLSSTLIGWAEDYMDGLWDCEPLESLTNWAMQNERDLAAIIDGHWSAAWLKRLHRVGHLLRRNSRRGSRRNIAHHYDLGNAFYRLWLDPSMTYSSALFSNETESLQQGQQNKYQKIIDWLPADNQPTPLRIAEIGCGWGGFAAQLTAQRPVEYRGITLSTEQLASCEARNLKDGESTIQFSLTDYRDLSGQFDAIVSIEMLEAVGEAHWPGYFSRINQLLRPGGTAVIQVITIDDDRFDSYRQNVDFIQKYIFPGGMLLTPQSMHRLIDESGLQLDEKMGFGHDYAATLRYWREGFDRAWPQIAALGYSERFRRMWRYYLCYCESGFDAESIDVRLYRIQKPLD